MTNNQDMANAYDEISDYYENFFSDWKTHKTMQSESYGEIIKQYGFSHKSCIFDITCGIGTQIIGLYENGFKNIKGSDISKKQVQRAHMLCKKYNIETSLFECDACEIDNIIQQESIDVVLSSSNSVPLLGSLKNITTMLEKIYISLKKGGIFIANIRDYTDLMKSKPLIAEMGKFNKNNIENIWYETADWNNDNTYLSDIYFSQITNNKINGRKFSFPKIYCVCKNEFIKILKEAGFDEVDFLESGYKNISRPLYIAKK